MSSKELSPEVVKRQQRIRKLNQLSVQAPQGVQAGYEPIYLFNGASGAREARKPRNFVDKPSGGVPQQAGHWVPMPFPPHQQQLFMMQGPPGWQPMMPPPQFHPHPQGQQPYPMMVPCPSGSNPNMGCWPGPFMQHVPGAGRPVMMVPVMPTPFGSTGPGAQPWPAGGPLPAGARTKPRSSAPPQEAGALALPEPETQQPEGEEEGAGQTMVPLQPDWPGMVPMPMPGRAPMPMPGMAPLAMPMPGKRGVKRPFAVPVHFVPVPGPMSGPGTTDLGAAPRPSAVGPMHMVPVPAPMPGPGTGDSNAGPRPDAMGPMHLVPMPGTLPRPGAMGPVQMVPMPGAAPMQGVPPGMVPVCYPVPQQPQPATSTTPILCVGPPPTNSTTVPGAVSQTLPIAFDATATTIVQPTVDSLLQPAAASIMQPPPLSPLSPHLADGPQAQDTLDALPGLGSHMDLPALSWQWPLQGDVAAMQTDTATDALPAGAQTETVTAKVQLAAVGTQAAVSPKASKVAAAVATAPAAEAQSPQPALSASPSRGAHDDMPPTPEKHVQPTPAKLAPASGDAGRPGDMLSADSAMQQQPASATGPDPQPQQQATSITGEAAAPAVATPASQQLPQAVEPAQAPVPAIADGQAKAPAPQAGAKPEVQATRKASKVRPRESLNDEELHVRPHRVRAVQNYRALVNGTALNTSGAAVQSAAAASQPEPGPRAGSTAAADATGAQPLVNGSEPRAAVGPAGGTDAAAAAPPQPLDSPKGAGAQPAVAHVPALPAPRVAAAGGSGTKPPAAGKAVQLKALTPAAAKQAAGASTRPAAPAVATQQQPVAGKAANPKAATPPAAQQTQVASARPQRAHKVHDYRALAAGCEPREQEVQDHGAIAAVAVAPSVQPAVAAAPAAQPETAKQLPAAGAGHGKRGPAAPAAAATPAQPAAAANGSQQPAAAQLRGSQVLAAAEPRKRGLPDGFESGGKHITSYGPHSTRAKTTIVGGVARPRRVHAVLDYKALVADRIDSAKQGTARDVPAGLVKPASPKAKGMASPVHNHGIGAVAAPKQASPVAKGGSLPAQRAHTHAKVAPKTSPAAKAAAPALPRLLPFAGAAGSVKQPAAARPRPSVVAAPAQTVRMPARRDRRSSSPAEMQAAQLPAPTDTRPASAATAGAPVVTPEQPSADAHAAFAVPVPCAVPAGTAAEAAQPASAAAAEAPTAGHGSVDTIQPAGSAGRTSCPIPSVDAKAEPGQTPSEKAQSLLRLLKKLGLLGVLGSCEPRAVWLWDTDEWDPCWMNQEALDRVSFDAPDVTCLTLSPDEEALIGREWRALQTAWRAAERRYASVLADMQQGKNVGSMNECCEIVTLRELVDSLNAYVTEHSSAPARPEAVGSGAQATAAHIPSQPASQLHDAPASDAGAAGVVLPEDSSQQQAKPPVRPRDDVTGQFAPAKKPAQAQVKFKATGGRKPFRDGNGRFLKGNNPRVCTPAGRVDSMAGDAEPVKLGSGEAGVGAAVQSEGMGPGVQHGAVSEQDPTAAVAASVQDAGAAQEFVRSRLMRSALLMPAPVKAATLQHAEVEPGQSEPAEQVAPEMDYVLQEPIDMQASLFSRRTGNTASVLMPAVSAGHDAVVSVVPYVPLTREQEEEAVMAAFALV